MSVELVILGLISAARPSTSQAAVFALLRAPAAARTLLAFTLAGLVVSIVLGLLVVLAFGGVGGAVGRSDFAAAFDVLAGIAAVGFAAGVHSGGFERRPGRSGGSRTSALARRLHNPSVGAAAAAGVATHVPGLIYLVALNSIAASDPGLAEAAVEVGIYNLLWFAVPVAALVLALRSPEMAGAYLDRVSAWARRHQDRLLVVLFGGLGVYLVLKGLLALS